MLVTVRDETHSDLESVRMVNSLAFGQETEPDLVDRLRVRCDGLISLVAETEGRIAGHILFSPATLECADGTVKGMGLAPMAVLPEYQRKGIGSKLVLEGISRLRKQGCPYVIVLGHPEYYPRFGFEPAGPLGVRCEWDVPEEAFMILILNPEQLRAPAGLARYRPEFAEAV